MPLDTNRPSEDRPNLEEDRDKGDAESQPAPPKPENMHKNAQKQEPYRRPAPKIGRNQACPCGSGKKYKRCCLGKPLAAAA
jgi:preprotein translocase subunit SecA